MVKHVVLYFLKDKSKKSKDALVDKFMSMKGKIDCLKSIEAGEDFMASDRSADVVLFCTFASKADLETYAEHPVHIPVKQYVKSVVERSVSCDYEIEE